MLGQPNILVEEKNWSKNVGKKSSLKKCWSNFGSGSFFFYKKFRLKCGEILREKKIAQKFRDPPQGVVCVCVLSGGGAM